ncbi:MAG: glycerate kinase [Sedimentisphaerales bacterium]|nr:glycerate kinase [Sedimentisphaerales bacterium]
MKIVIAMDSFKGTLSAAEVCEIIASVIKENLPEAECIMKPIADGGEGTAESMLKSISGKWIEKNVTGPLFDMKVDAGFAWFEESKTALVEMASAAGIQLLTDEQLNPMKTTTYGVGELIKTAIEYNPEKILFAIGGSATTDGGTGLAAALGWQFLDKDGDHVAGCGGGLNKIVKIIPPKEQMNIPIEVLCDVQNPLCGEHGAARIYGPQKGATPEMVEELEAGLCHLGNLIKEQLGRDVLEVPGAGAAGGLGAASLAFMNGKLVSGIDTIIEHSNIEAELQNADWIITGEGCFDTQSLYGKVVAGISKIANKAKVRISVIAGQVRLDKSEYKKIGIVSAHSCKPENMNLEEALEKSRELLASAAKKFVNENLL